jgi:hypothetical protein
VPTLLFGLGAIGVAANPDGQLAANVRTAERLALKVLRARTGGEPGGRSEAAASVGGADVADVLETTK